MAQPECDNATLRQKPLNGVFAVHKHVSEVQSFVGSLVYGNVQERPSHLDRKSDSIALTMETGSRFLSPVGTKL
jgi:hypothetical protein